MSESKHTPGPWRWEINLKSKNIQLCGGVPRYDLTVMDFDRWGMQRAAPRLREDVDRMSIMHRCDRWAKAVPGREHHANWFQTVDHPDMRLIAAAPDLLAACEALLAASGGRTSHSLDMVREAVAKATEEAK